MNRLPQIAVILLLSIQLSSQLKTPKNTGNCSYFGEPHLVPFPTSPGGVQNQYVCHPTSVNEVLLQNTFIKIGVTVSSSGNNPIIAYNLEIFPTGVYSSSCIVTDTSGSVSPTISCPPSSAASVTVGGSSVHIIHLTQYIIVNIDKDFTKGNFFDIYITQSFDLITKSKGVCIKYACIQEIPPPVGRKKRQQQDPSLIPNICQAATDNAQKNAPGPIDPDLVTSGNIACQYDLSATYFLGYIQPSIKSIIRSASAVFEGADNYADYLVKGDAISQQTFCDAVPIINGLIQQSSSACSDDGDNSQCFEVNDYPDLCSGK